MKTLIVTIFACLALTATAQAGRDASLCRSANAQNGSGQAFSSRQECVRAPEVFAPTLTSSPASFGAQEQFTLTASGLHPNATTLTNFALTGQAEFFSYELFLPRTDANGNISISFNSSSFSWIAPGCGSPTHLTLTIVDSFGVHASTEVVLC